MISETKIDSSFPSAQFHMEGYANPYKLDRIANGSGILLYTRVCKIFLYTKFSVELKSRKIKWFLSCSYNHPKGPII